ncbi:CBS domain protein [Actinomyces sp. oral taxon 848 str. F0332]|uniref:Magnesium/cobalt efflux protein n=1 Tax=Peptidiphaga gingivicola TaxID=2741497 RepID=A0A179B5Y3_9ACTO|nr:hemolysin family protein [Peptidiphaga gingivicola]EEZ78032.1 CBS domain protein [Actinomyces sp. oral taxon 848 str. F0332]OAP86830.1 magnesium/cobalt efflux protein [Peptidiphaga gingivicola]
MNGSNVPLAALAALAFVCYGIGALFSAGLTALGRITRAEAADAPKASKRMLSIVSRRQAAIAGLISLRIFFTSLAAVLAVLALASVLDEWWEAVGGYLALTAAASLMLRIVSPASIGARRPVETLALISLPAALATSVASSVVREGEDDDEEFEQLHEDQLAVMVERVSDSTVLDESDRELLQSVFDFNHTLVREVMVPRTDMVSIGIDAPLDKAMSLFTRSGFSRVPVVGESADDLHGVVYLKDVLRRWLRGNTESLTVADLMREPVFVPETKVVDDLMREMQANQVHIALVVDEYGGIAGLVTIEDLVEELVGEISDEHDRSAPEVDVVEEGVYRVPARLPIADLGELFGVKLDDDDVDTVGGLFAKLIGRVPIAGSRASIGGISLTADRFQGRRRRLWTVLARREDEGESDE